MSADPAAIEGAPSAPCQVLLKPADISSLVLAIRAGSGLPADAPGLLSYVVGELRTIHGAAAAGPRGPNGAAVPTGAANAPTGAANAPMGAASAALGLIAALADRLEQDRTIHQLERAERALKHWSLSAGRGYTLKLRRVARDSHPATLASVRLSAAGFHNFYARVDHDEIAAIGGVMCLAAGNAERWAAKMEQLAAGARAPPANALAGPPLSVSYAPEARLTRARPRHHTPMAQRRALGMCSARGSLQPSAGVTPAGATPAGATSAGAAPAGATPAGATPAGATPAGATPADEPVYVGAAASRWRAPPRSNAI